MKSLGPDSELGHFRVVRKIGAGGMGVVYLARDLDLQRDVALKVLPPELMADEERRVRFLREARSAAAVTHAHIATVYEVGEEDGRVFIALEYIEGTSLRDVLADGALPVSDALRIARQMLRGLRKAHDAGIVHRDLKPDNVMLDSEGSVKLLDFGLAKLRADEGLEEQSEEDVESGETQTAITAEGRVLGTPGYMAPEQALGKTVDARADLFSLGTIVYEMLSGQRAFTGDTPMQLVVATTRDEPVSITSVNDDVSDELASFISRSLAKAPEERFASADEMLAALVDLAPSIHSGQLPVPSRRSPQGASQSAPVVAPRASRTLMVAGVAVVIVALGALYVTTGADALTAPAASAPASSTAADAQFAPGWHVPRVNTTSDAARSAFLEGYRLFHDTGYDDAVPAWERALEEDPALAAAHLRLAFFNHIWRQDPAKARHHLTMAERRKADLDEHDALLWSALEPMVRRQPADDDTAFAKLSDAVEQFPADPELLFVRGILHGNVGQIIEQVAANEELVKASPRFVLGWATLAESTAYAGHFDRSRQAVAECLELAPTSDCLSYSFTTLAQQGKCEEAEATARRIIAARPESGLGYLFLAVALSGRQRPLASITETLKQYRARLPDESKAHRQLQLDAKVAQLRGDFAGAEDKARALSLLVENSSRRRDHAWVARSLVETYLERGDVALAATVADEFLDKRDGWEADPRIEDYAIARDISGLMLRASSRSDSVERRDQWLADWRKRLSKANGFYRFLWFDGYAELSVDAASAKSALDALGEFSPIPPYSPHNIGEPLQHRAVVETAVGRTYFYAEDYDSAVSWLEKGSRRCGVLASPIDSTHACYWLGRAHAEAKRNEAACEAFRMVVKRWGKAKPRSVTADDARNRMRALRCE